MKKYFFALFISFLPCFLFAQSDGPVVEDFYKDIKGLESTVKINDHLFVMQVNTSNDSFDLVGVNENMQVIWTTTIDGYGINIGKFKNKLLAIAATEHSTFKGNSNTYKGILIDPATGNKLVEKVIYDDSQEYYEIPQAIIRDNFFKLAVRESGVTRGVKVGMPGIFVIFSLDHLSKEYVETQKLEILDFNEKLDVISTTTPAVNGRFVDVTCNSNADNFVTWLNGPDIEVYKYPAGKNTPSTKLNADVSFTVSDNDPDGPGIIFQPSPVKPDILFYSAIYKNTDHQVEMMLGKMDFAKGTKQSITKVFLHDDIKALEKSFVPVNKKIKDADVGNPKYFSTHSFSVGDNVEIITLQGTEAFSSSSGGYIQGKSVLYNVFDDNLQLKFQQIFPETYRSQFVAVAAGDHIDKDKLYVLGSMLKGGYDHVGLYGILNLNNGQWEKMETVKDKPIKCYIDAGKTIWLKDYFIVPYITAGGFFSPLKHGITLQQNQY